MQGLAELLRRGTAESFVILILRPNSDAGNATQSSAGLELRMPPVLERFVLELSNSSTDGGPTAPSLDLASLRAQLCGFLLNVNVCNSRLSPRGTQELAFRIEIHSRQARTELSLPDGMRQRWVECDPQSEVGSPQGPSRIVPLKSMRTPGLGMQLFVHASCGRGDR